MTVSELCADVDGGLFAHDPASCALTLAMSRLRRSCDSILLMSMGTGHVPKHISNEHCDWGVVQWFPHLTSLLWDGMVRSESQR
jgi:hypothetical protein